MTPTLATPLTTIAPAIVALIAIALLSLPPEPARQRFSAVFVAGAGSTYLGGGFGPLELVFCAIITMLAYRGLDDYGAIGFAWVLHSCWDAAHDLWGRPILPFAADSSYGCFVCDFWLAAWYFAGAPNLWRREPAAPRLDQVTATLQGCTLVALVCIAVPAQLLFGLRGAIAAVGLAHVLAVAVHALVLRKPLATGPFALDAVVPFMAFRRLSAAGSPT